MKIADTSDGLQLEQPQQLPDLFIRLESDLTLQRPGRTGPLCPDHVGDLVGSPAFFILLIEINQQRLIARQLESRAFARRHVHACESIPHAPVEQPCLTTSTRVSSIHRSEAILVIPRPRALATVPPSCLHRLETAVRIPGPCMQQFHPAAHSVPEGSHELLGPRRASITTAPPANPSRRTASPRERLPSARRLRTHPRSRAR